MAKGNLFLGMARKKIGDVVFYRANGEQISRARNRAPRNPRSAKQSIQRMVLATASKMAAAWRPLVNHSYNVGEDSVRHFQQLAMARLRGQAAYIINGGQEFSVADFAIKGAPIVGKSEGLRISSGSLSFTPWTTLGEGVYRLLGAGNLDYSEAFTTQAGYEAVLASFGLEPGDQLTFVCIQENVNIPVASFGTITNYAQRVRYARVVFKPTLPEGFNGSFNDDGEINAALIERVEGSVPPISSADDGHLDFNMSDGDWLAVQGGFIRSAIDVNGKWRYSTCDLASDRADFDENNAIGVYPSYGNNAEGIDIGDNLYLRNAIAAPLGN